MMLERLPGGACTHWKAPPLHGAHPNRTLERPSNANRELAFLHLNLKGMVADPPHGSAILAALLGTRPVCHLDRQTARDVAVYFRLDYALTSLFHFCRRSTPCALDCRVILSSRNGNNDSS